MEDLFKLGRLCEYRKNELIASPTNLSADMYVLIEGLVHVYTIDQSGEKNVHIIYGKDDIFPVPWLIRKQPLNNYYEAITNCKLLKLNARQAVQHIKVDADASFKLLTQVAKQFVTYKARVDNLEYKFARERIAYCLLFLGRRFGHLEGEVLIMPRFNQEEIGNTTNVSRESVSRELKRFERLGYIKYEPGQIKILNQKGLHKELTPEGSALFIDDLYDT